MEAATLSSPQRKFDAVPVQKSLSLPSYAKAGGEGIDHRIIFAALEQREKVRRKSIIFKREKTARHNIFCLPISSGAKCRETSFSSDTSCSSLEYQKPKAASKPKKEEAKPPENETAAGNETKVAKTSQHDVKSNPNHNEVASRNGVVDQESPRSRLKVAEYYRQGHRSPTDTLKPNINSSDSMERSSRSSNDSLSRKERLVAIKAKVEAAREKYGDTSSEDENRSGITRYNSDGVIHRTVREVKSRSYRLEKRLRRRSQDEYGMRKANRKNNLSLCLNSIDDGMNLELYNSPLNIFEESRNLECKTDFCPSPNFLEFTKKNYFSDFPSKENMTRMVQARIRQIEEEERKRRNGSDFRDKTRISSRQSPQNAENQSPFSTQCRNVLPSDKAVSSSNIERNIPSSDAVKCPSPVGRAPTPPPRSPKSMSFVNKAYMQHQSSYLNQDSRSLERKPYYKPNIPATQCMENSKTDALPNGSRAITNTTDDSAERRKLKELFNARRKTCSYFDCTESFVFKDLHSSNAILAPSKSSSIGANANASQSSPKSFNTKACFSSNEIPPVMPEDPNRRLWRSKWEETEKKHEYMFNSLESKKKTLSSSWVKSGTSQKNDACFCRILSGDNAVCSCNSSLKNRSNNASLLSRVDCASNFVKLKELEAQENKNRLSKSEVNISYSEQPQSKLHNLNAGNLFSDSQPAGTTYSSDIVKNNSHTEKLSATANLDSAMEELESVYRSLKFSSDTLSEKNSESNLSLNDLNVDTSKPFSRNKNADMPFKPCSPKENNINFYENKPYNSKPVFDKRPEEFCQSPVFSSLTPISKTCKSPETENICIDELFNDLTRQLDIEQKLLKETSRDNRIESRASNDNCDKRDQKRMTPLESIVSIRKELYNNLQKNSQEQITSFNPVTKGVSSSQNPQLETARKKYKAVRSLSENISYLMANSSSSPTSPRKTPPEKPESFSFSMQTRLVENSSPRPYEPVALELSKSETKKEMPLNQPLVPKRTFVSDRLKKRVGEEIRQIRVSMDTDVSDAKSVMKTQFSDYPRLSSAISRPQMAPRNESPRIPPSSVPKESIDVLDENGLEKLLNTLLNDVPDSKQSSLLHSNDKPPSTPPPATSSAGEMRVLQHLDILRLNPIPS